MSIRKIMVGSTEYDLVASKLTEARTIALSGDVSGSTAFDGSGDVTITATVADDSHNHVISNVDGLQAALDGKASSSHTHSAYVNQNAFSNITVGSTTIAADSATDTLTLAAGSNVTITPDATNDKITIAATNTWRGIQDNLTSTSTTESLSANQGKILKDSIDRISELSEDFVNSLF